MERIETTALDQAKPQRGPITFPGPPIPANVVRETSWADLPAFTFDLSLLNRNRVVTASRSDPNHVAFDVIRTKILQEMRKNNWTSVAITSPTPGCGKTLVSLNLAFSLAHQKECRTLLLDLGLASLQMSRLLGLRNAGSVEKFLSGQATRDKIFLKHGANMAVGANGLPSLFSAELLQSGQAAEVLKAMENALRPDIIIYDMPPMLSGDDVIAFLPKVDCVALVVAAEDSTLSETDYCERELSAKTNFLGCILNKCRYPQADYGY